MQQVEIRNLGLISYEEAWQLQEKLFHDVVERKLRIREGEKIEQIHYLLFCEHPPVYTLGKSGSEQNLLLNEEGLKKQGVEFFKINRGGDITFHGPGQLVCYPIFDLDFFFTDIHKYLRFLEEAVILTLKELGIFAERLPGLTGVWLDVKTNPRKICAMGVRCSRWVTMHGLALNVSPDLSFFNHIIPCGISDKAVTSIEKETGIKYSVKEVEGILLKFLQELFVFNINQPYEAKS